ncbi:MAG: radical SAM protein [Nanoarchaeota archaeon]|nr:radical SAM protein [Nanoarchaeota archaeon]
MRCVEDTPFYSRKLGNLPKGCEMCVKGEKLVLYITGVCPRSCWYCPLSDNRKDKDVIYANEWKIENMDEMLEEANLTEAKGAGITGGDPLARIDRTVDYIKFLKKKFGKKFHIHLYTIFVLATDENLKKLYDAGLDEIRFHPDFNLKEQWSRIDRALKYDWEVGLEIPAIPMNKKEIFEMIDFFEGKVKFLNVNELEVAERNMDDMEKFGYETKTDISHGILGSEDFAEELMEYCQDKDINVHFCTSKLKDKVQMQNRLKKRAKNVASKFDIETDEGLLLKGVIYLKELVPGIDFKKKLEKIDRDDFIKKLNETKEFLEEEGLDLEVDEIKLRLISYPEHVEQFAKELKDLDLVPAIVEEDPTVEAFELNRDFL